MLLAAVTVNGVLGLAGTLALSLVGQMAFGVLVDACGWFGLRRRRPSPREAAGLALALAGSLVMLAARG